MPVGVTATPVILEKRCSKCESGSPYLLFGLTAPLCDCRRIVTRRRTVATGTVKWFNPTKGYGFIQPSGGGGGKDVFVHISAVEKAGLSTLREGQQMEYEMVNNRGKESAENLKIK
jgi:CspA family cold shock protein